MQRVRQYLWRKIGGDIGRLTFSYAMFALCLAIAIASDYISKNVLTFHTPAVRGEFRMAKDCNLKAEALVIALTAAPYVYRD